MTSKTGETTALWGLGLLYFLKTFLELPDPRNTAVAYYTSTIIIHNFTKTNIQAKAYFAMGSEKGEAYENIFIDPFMWQQLEWRANFFDHISHRLS